MFSNTQNFKKEKKRKNIAVLFSGGLDSTYLIYKNLNEGHKVHPIYIEIGNNYNKSQIEKQTIVRLYDLLKNMFCKDNYNLSQPRLISKVEIWQGRDSGLKFNQIPIWLFGLNFIGLTSYDEVQIGYVANDDAIPYLNEIKKTYDVMKWFNRNPEQVAKLTFPIAQTTKYDMLETLPSSIRELVFSCENPNLDDNKYEINSLTVDPYFIGQFLGKERKFHPYEPCGECVSCQKILNNDTILNYYQYSQPIFRTLKYKEIIRQYENLKERSTYDSEIKDVFIQQENKKINWEGEMENLNVSKEQAINSQSPILTAVQEEKHDYSSVDLIDKKEVKTTFYSDNEANKLSY